MDMIHASKVNECIKDLELKLTEGIMQLCLTPLNTIGGKNCSIFTKN